ncbi:hypothetical protein [Taibaiella soli]|uniref:Uncharacterized protein n=1 Tax=Taibaiella soli TaxID=1649169 RepID=A0A2W2ADL3_9BACT|nr:hypothetical protein [Taibaiella soli]PZF73535.1 hypothetical protein DN068_07360 [Taibaiella soli]
MPINELNQHFVDEQTLTTINGMLQQTIADLKPGVQNANLTPDERKRYVVLCNKTSSEATNFQTTCVY